MPIIPIEQLTNAVINIRQKSGASIINGTGSFIIHEKTLYLLTAEHVAKEVKVDCQFIVKGENDTPVTLTVEDLMQGSDLHWKIHPEADMAILKLNPKNEVMTTKLAKRFLSSEIIYKEKKAVDRNTLLFVIGFPLGLGAVGHFSPLTFRTHAASGLLSFNRFDNHKRCSFVVLENPGVGGFSGGPVVDLSLYQNMGMRMAGRGTFIHGILHGTLKDETGGKLAVVTPSYYFFDLV